MKQPSFIAHAKSSCLLCMAAPAKNYQSAIWRKALEKDCEIPSPHGHGWQLKYGELNIHWMDQEPAPKSLLELVSCKCKTGCSGRRCSCHKVGLLCTDVCDKMR